ncbi:MAG: CoA pyrophosphatase [Sneathiellaceae bacterium]
MTGPPADDRQLAEAAVHLGAFPRLASAADPSLKHAAVAIVLLGPAAERSVILTRRAAGLRRHGGQWALPGGRCEAGESAGEAGLRELAEEVGLFLPASRILGQLDDYPTRSGYRITPLVVWGGEAPALRPDPAEVAAIHLVPLADLARPDAVDFVSIPESERQVVRFRIGERLIHAPTAALLYQFREALAGRVTRVAELEQPPFAWR